MPVLVMGKKELSCGHMGYFILSQSPKITATEKGETKKYGPFKGDIYFISEDRMYDVEKRFFIRGRKDIHNDPLSHNYHIDEYEGLALEAALLEFNREQDNNSESCIELTDVLRPLPS
jgi:hypothetical protein